ncbi:alpha/beta hydrolase [Streptomyces roseicoloratus]|uniref:alpha/beta hydrolase n=1 Tax=Streptomyces roseicoloratus TaxID=2508722 RepID=UPI00100992A3|nr:alpha/beta hydrolase [Streptomyces roseicoloratus]
MKPRLVFVHGIGAPRDAAAERDEWLRAVAAGARAAGHSASVSGLTGGWAADARFAYYGDLFRTAGAQGGGATPAGPAGATREPDDELLAALLLEAVDARLADPSPPDPAEHRALRAARVRLAPPAGAQGAGAPARRVVNAVTSLLAVPGLRALGGRLTARVTAGMLGQVARYLNRGEPDGDTTLDQRIRARVAESLDPEGPNIVVAHSLGTVVALETLHEHPVDVPLFVTLGSPLGIRTAVLPRVRPHPLGTPAAVGRWLNFWDRDDLVAARPRLEDVVRPNAAAVVPASRRVDSDGAWVHPAAKYLAQPAVAGPLVEALTTLTER